MRDKADIIRVLGGLKMKQFFPTFRNHYLISNEDDIYTNKCQDTRRRFKHHSYNKLTKEKDDF